MNVGLSGPLESELLTVDDLIRMSRPAWHRDAACKEHPEVTFFPARGEDAQPAKAVCAGCLVRVECASYAQDVDATIGELPVHGIWGGLSGRERRQARPIVDKDAPRRGSVYAAALELAATGVAITAHSLHDLLRSQGRPTTLGGIGASLSQLAASGRLVRSAPGVYGPPSRQQVA